MSVDVIAYDWEASATSQSIINNVLNGLEKNNNSGIVLMHDNQKINIEALPKLLDALRAKTVSYTHLDVYKRQVLPQARLKWRVKRGLALF